MMINSNLANELSEKGWVPDGIIRTGIRALLERRLTDIRAGEKVVMWYWSANRDETVFDDPARFDITRPNTKDMAVISTGRKRSSRRTMLGSVRSVIA